jgi:hypothetical protein
MRSIQVSTDTYAAIWGARRAGEDTEDEILRRILQVKSVLPVASPPAKIGFADPRFGIKLPEGFEIFRTYKGVAFQAKALGGKWVLDATGKSYPSLNQLSRAVTGKIENAWQNWYYVDATGKRQLVSGLRPQTTLRDLGLE